MLSFSSLNSNERTLLMLMAYFYKYGQTKKKLSNLLEKIMLPSLSDLAFKKLMTDGLLVEVNLHYYGGGKVLYINKDMLIPSLLNFSKKKTAYYYRIFADFIKRLIIMKNHLLWCV